MLCMKNKKMLITKKKSASTCYANCCVWPFNHTPPALSAQILTYNELVTVGSFRFTPAQRVNGILTCLEVYCMICVRATVTCVVKIKFDVHFHYRTCVIVETDHHC